jgi:hypothetical protein
MYFFDSFVLPSSKNLKPEKTKTKNRESCLLHLINVCNLGRKDNNNNNTAAATTTATTTAATTTATAANNNNNNNNMQ